MTTTPDRDRLARAELALRRLLQHRRNGTGPSPGMLDDRIDERRKEVDSLRVKVGALHLGEDDG